MVLLWDGVRCHDIDRNSCVINGVYKICGILFLTLVFTWGKSTEAMFTSEDKSPDTYKEFLLKEQAAKETLAAQKLAEQIQQQQLISGKKAPSVTVITSPRPSDVIPESTQPIWLPWAENIFLLLLTAGIVYVVIRVAA